MNRSGAEWEDEYHDVFGVWCCGVQQGSALGGFGCDTWVRLKTVR